MGEPTYPQQRILSIGDDHVRFLTKDGKSCTLTPEQFIRRFLLHVLPPRFVKIRHYGLMAPANATTRLEQARQILRPSDVVPPALAVLILAALLAANIARLGPLDWRQRLKHLSGVDLQHCPACGARWTRIPLPSTRGSDTS